MYLDPIIHGHGIRLAELKHLYPNRTRLKSGALTLMANLENGPEHLMFLLALMRCIFGVLHFIAEFQEGVFDVIEACWGWLAIARCADWRHLSDMRSSRI